MVGMVTSVRFTKKCIKLVPHSIGIQKMLSHIAHYYDFILSMMCLILNESISAPSTHFKSLEVVETLPVINPHKISTYSLLDRSVHVGNDLGGLSPEYRRSIAHWS